MSEGPRKAKPEPARFVEDDDGVELPQLTLLGDFPTQVTVVPRALCTLVMNMGTVEDEEGRRPVLLPHIEMKFAGIRQGDIDEEKGPEEQNLEDLFARILPLDNAVWLLSDLARDIRHACARFKRAASGPQVLETVRLGKTRAYAERLRQEAELTTALLDKLLASESQGGKPLRPLSDTSSTTVLVRRRPRPKPQS